MPARRAHTGDIDELLRLATLMFTAVGLDPAIGNWQQHGRQRLVTGLDDGNVVGFVLDDHQSTGGLMAAALATINQRLPTPTNPDGRVAYVQWVATDPRFRRQGAARALMLALLQWATHEQIAYVDLHASADGEPLYRALGFAEARNPELRLRLTE